MDGPLVNHVDVHRPAQVFVDWWYMWSIVYGHLSTCDSELRSLGYPYNSILLRFFGRVTTKRPHLLLFLTPRISPCPFTAPPAPVRLHARLLSSRQTWCPGSQPRDRTKGDSGAGPAFNVVFRVPGRLA